MKSISFFGDEHATGVGGRSETSALLLHPEYARLFQALEKGAVPFCLMRPPANLDSPQDDLDLLVSPDHRSASLRIFKSLGYEVIRSGRSNPGKLVVVRWDGTHAFYLDVHYAVVIQGFEYLDANRVLADSVRCRGAPYAADPDMALILLLHDVIGKRRVQPKYHAVLMSLWPTVPGSIALADASGRGLQGMLPESSADLERLFEDAAAEDLAARARRAMHWRPRTLANRLRIWLRSRVSRPGSGIVVALLGPDGSGKSSTVACLKDLIEQELRWPASVVYMGPWGHDFFDLTSSLRFPPPDSWRETLARRSDRLAAGARRPAVGEALMLEFRRRILGLGETDLARRAVVRDMAPSWMAFGWLRGHVRYWMSLAMLTLELSRRYWLVWRLSRRGRVVICDRYVYDLMTGEMHAINRRYEWARALICRVFPRPDVSVLLWNTADELHARKQQLSREHLKAFLDFYGTLAERFGFERVRTDVIPSDVARRIVDLTFVRAVEGLRS